MSDLALRLLLVALSTVLLVFLLGWVAGWDPSCAAYPHCMNPSYDEIYDYYMRNMVPK